MSKRPMLKGREVVAALSRLGFIAVGGRKHIKMRHPGGRIAMVPRHPGVDILPGTLAEIIRQANIAEDEFRVALQR